MCWLNGWKETWSNLYGSIQVWIWRITLQSPLVQHCFTGTMIILWVMSSHLTRELARLRSFVFTTLWNALSGDDNDIEFSWSIHHRGRTPQVQNPESTGITVLFVWMVTWEVYCNDFSNAYICWLYNWALSFFLWFALNGAGVSWWDIGTIVWLSTIDLMSSIVRGGEIVHCLGPYPDTCRV